MKNNLDKLNRRINILGILFFLVLSLPLFIFILSQFEFEDSAELSPIVEEKVVLEPGTIDPESGLIVDDGYELVVTHCGACHSLKLVTQNSSTEEGWRDIIRWMQNTQGLWDLGEDEAPILSYLSKNYPPKKSSRRPNLENVEWYDFN